MKTQIKEKINPQHSFQKKKLKYLGTGSIFALLIASTPFLFYIYRSFPDGPIWETSLFTYESLYFESVRSSAWTILNKLIPLVLLTIWFYTCKHWWYLVLLIPISMYLFQLVSIINDDIQYIDEIEIFFLAPIIIIILILLYSIRVKVFDKIHGIDISELNSAFKQDKKPWWYKFKHTKTHA